MREIGFRGKSILLKEFVYGFILQYEAGTFITDGMTLSQIDPETAGQYTGFTDKNGTKIFEGDIVKDEFGRIMKVIFLECWGKYQFTLVKATGERWTNNFIRADLTDWFVGVCPDALPEIIGNIYDNPELLGGAK